MQVQGRNYGVLPVVTPLSIHPFEIREFEANYQTNYKHTKSDTYTI